MIPTSAILRIARPTDNLAAITKMYVEGLGFSLLGNFEGHEGFNGSILGHPRHLYHIEFTHHVGTVVGKAPTKDHLLVFYLPDRKEWEDSCNGLISAGFVRKPSYNSYWDAMGKTFEDIDGYRVVLQNEGWSA